MNRDLAHTGDMLIAARHIRAFLGATTEDSFLRDVQLQSAVLYQMTILGEAARRVSAEFCALHPEIEWRRIAGMRNRIVHEYDDVSLDKVWETVQSEIPDLIRSLEAIVPPPPDGEE